ncbi:translation initiation factor III [Actinoplanes sp. TBRC 11911]|uniref:translation initiation factor III n=1 Tax=Actinoplanes sp. TBRC 11911 TaxID=2729386 RepID=UPI00145EE30F|nr:translation initiation factor III [Actinoplanes sp. TBRC 11911]NMO57654.1 translation initiation factor III [Actinoplanes sp. TBRC 11911]
MARTKNNQRSANRVAVDVGATGTDPVPKSAVIALVICAIAAIWAVAMMTPPGRVGYVYFFLYAEFYLGVICLVSLSITIMVGLVATDRLVLSIRQRVLLQSAHRTTGIIAVLSLIGHVWTKVVEGHISLIIALVPFTSVFHRFVIGLGVISGYIMILVMWTGLARSRFIGRGQPWMWRSIHAISYLMWPIALVHGLAAGRPAKSWVIVSYVICILAVLVGLAVRLSVSLNRRKDFASTAASGGAVKPVGKIVPTSNAAPKKQRRREREQELAPVAVVDTFEPVMAPPVFEEPAAAPRQRRAVEDAFNEPTGLMSPRALEDERGRGRRYANDDQIEFDEPAPRGRRYAGEETGTRMRMEDTGTRMRPDETGTRMRPDDTGTRMRPDDTGTRMRSDDTGTRMRRPDFEDTSTRMRRVEMDDSRSGGYEAPRQRRYAEDETSGGRRRADDYYDDAPRGSRHADPGDYDERPRARSPRYADEEPPRRGGRTDSRYGGEAEDAPRARRDRGADIDGADSGRHSRSQFVDLAAQDDYIEPDETPTLVDMASRRARRQAQKQDTGRAPRGGRKDDEVTDDDYWSQLRGEAN